MRINVGATKGVINSIWDVTDMEYGAFRLTGMTNLQKERPFFQSKLGHIKKANQAFAYDIFQRGKPENEI